MCFLLKFIIPVTFTWVHVNEGFFFFKAKDWYCMAVIEMLVFLGLGFVRLFVIVKNWTHPMST